MTENMTKIAPGIYLVRTQAGFRKAIKNRFSKDFEDWRWMAKNRMKGYPKSYPAVVSLSLGYNGDHCFLCNSVPVNLLKAALVNV